jgi:DNA-binding MarR family transcriptional regulator
MLVLLEGLGLVAREQHPVDGRARSVSITKRRLKIYKRLLWAFEPFLAQVASDFQPEEVQTLQGLLRRIPPVLTARSASGGPG